MGLILNIETSTKKCSISLAKDGIPYLVIEEYSEFFFHAEKIHKFINSAFEANLFQFSDLYGICVNKGPGSYTGLRIGLSVAKGLCYGLNIPLLSIDTLSLMIEELFIKKGIFIPMVDANFKEVYISIYDENKTKITPIQTITLNKNSFKQFIQSNIYIIGNTIKKVKFIIKIPVFFISKIHSSAQMMAFLSKKKKTSEKIERFEPIYSLVNENK